MHPEDRDDRDDRDDRENGRRDELKGKILRPAPAHGLLNAIVVAVAWAWRLLLIAAAVYVVVEILKMVSLVVFSIIAAVFLAALLRPVANGSSATCRDRSRLC